jgi:hypothetical protein
VQRAAERARARQIGNVQFFKGDPTEMQFDRPFDAVIGGSSLCIIRIRSMLFADWPAMFVMEVYLFFKNLI